MKKRMLLAVMAVGTMLLAAGCGGKKEAVKTDYVDDLSKYITLGEYKGLEYEEESAEVTDADVEAELAYLAQSVAQPEQIMEGTVAEGDTVNIDYRGLRDGEAFDGGSDEDFNLTIGSGQFIPGFEEQLAGMVPGETKSIEVTFPDPYDPNPDLAGVPVVFEVTANYICGEYIVPELTDEFIAANTDYETLDEYREYVRGYLTEYKEEAVQTNKEQGLWQQVMDGSEVTAFPEDKVNEEVENMFASYEQYAGYYGLEMADFLEQMGMTEEAFRTEMTTYAEDMVKRNLVFYSIVEAEGLAVSEEEYEEGSEAMASEYGYESAEAMEEAVTREVIEEDMLWEKVLDLILSSAKAKAAAQE